MGVRERYSDSVVSAAAAAAAAVAAPRGAAPTIDPRHNYYLLPPGHGRGYDLVNPGKILAMDTCSYPVHVGVHTVQVLLKKKCFLIITSPPPTAQCKCNIRPDGKLTVGWLGDIKNAWRIVLAVLGIGEDGNLLPLFAALPQQPAPEPQRAAVDNSEPSSQVVDRWVIVNGLPLMITEWATAADLAYAGLGGLEVFAEADAANK